MFKSNGVIRAPTLRGIGVSHNSKWVPKTLPTHQARLKARKNMNLSRDRIACCDLIGVAVASAQVTMVLFSLLVVRCP